VKNVLLSSELWGCVVRYKFISVSEEPDAFIFRISLRMEAVPPKFWWSFIRINDLTHRWQNSAQRPPFKMSNFGTYFIGRNMTQQVSRQAFTRKGMVHSKAIPCGICGWQCGTWGRFFWGYVTFSSVSIIPPGLHIQISFIYNRR